MQPEAMVGIAGLTGAQGETTAEQAVMQIQRQGTAVAARLTYCHALYMCMEKATSGTQGILMMAHNLLLMHMLLLSL